MSQFKIVSNTLKCDYSTKRYDGTAWSNLISLMRSSLMVRASSPVATVLGSIPASIGTVEFEELQMKQC